MRGLQELVDESTILPQCIRAYKNNIAGFGISIDYNLDYADETPEMKTEFDKAQKNNESEDVISVLKQIKKALLEKGAD